MFVTLFLHRGRTAGRTHFKSFLSKKKKKSITDPHVQNLGWFSSVVVDGTAYKLMGDTNDPPILPANQTAVEFTPTRTSFIFTAGTMQINMSFISPIEVSASLSEFLATLYSVDLCLFLRTQPTDLVRQSLPFSYVTMSASSLDGNAHALRVFINISGR